ncbi:NADH dehydrogenase [ubiquinone] 1 alpha subcomplex assembly factor 2 [Pseudonaja textilis]|uniref:NADH:ubiquinone oxidoreductase complex assembly factor 2 n=1 Tax=Pseudonaja textilis TaxID=8673 RepID=A0A670XMH5_PSETE|nr:NADH dehydrogenase [ubiquinone] 1 alpha subcomplex assembly factor 2 [Pseudonaja textilis]
MSGVWRFLRLLKQRFIGPGSEYVGIDHFGNKYYRIPQHKTWAGQNIKERRIVKAVSLKEYQYESGAIPTEWEAWMKKRRNNPPTLEESIQNKNYRKEMKAKVEDLGEKSKLLQAKDREEGLEVGPLQTQITGHASASNYRKPERSEDPVSTANTFQPGAWMPPDHKK